jgi:glutathione S-transferase
LPKEQDTPRPEIPSSTTQDSTPAARDTAQEDEAVGAPRKTSQDNDEESTRITTLTPDSEENSEESGSNGNSPKEPTASGKLCEGDTRIFYNVLPPSVEKGVFERLREEVKWLRMAHQGGEVPRLVCIQGQVDKDGNMPVYRHPSDESPPLVPFTKTVVQIKDQVEKILGHPLNHVLIQLYRDGNDYISEHSDKTLDIVKGSFICNVSLGAERTMTFRTKRPDKDASRDVKAASSEQQGPKRTVARARLPHNSLCRMGLETNMRWLHAIRQDKRREQEKDAAELAYAGGRISLTFRHIGTYLNRDGTLIWGQGAVSKTREAAQPVINGQTPGAVKMLQAFGTENHSSEFVWDKYYGEGFNVLHMSNAPRFFLSSDPVANMRIQLMLAEAGIGYAKGSMAKSGTGDAEASSSQPASTETLPIKFVDNDPGKSVVEGDVAIMLYLDGVRSRTREKAVSPPDLGRRYTRFQQALALHGQWNATLAQTKTKMRNSGGDEDGGGAGERKRSVRPRVNYCKQLKRELTVWNGYATETADVGFIAGGEAPSLADFALWPVLYAMQESSGGDQAFAANLMGIGCKDLLAYYLILATRSSVKRVLKGAAEP